MQSWAVTKPGVYSWHDLDLAGRMFPLDSVLRESSAMALLDVDMAKCMAVPVLQRALASSPYDKTWQEALRLYQAKPGPNKC